MARLSRDTNGKVGGYLVGRRHRDGGIRAVNVDSGAPLEVESDEVIITRRAVLSQETHDFDGEQLTNLEVLSRINQAGGGVALLEAGGQVGENVRCRCSGKTYQYGGQVCTDRQIVERIQASSWREDNAECHRQLLAIEAALSFSRGPERSTLLKMRDIAAINYKSTIYG